MKKKLFSNGYTHLDNDPNSNNHSLDDTNSNNRSTELHEFTKLYELKENTENQELSIQHKLRVPGTANFLQRLQEVEKQINALENPAFKNKLNHEIAEIIKLELQNLSNKELTKHASDRDAIQALKEAGEFHLFCLTSANAKKSLSKKDLSKLRNRDNFDSFTDPHIKWVRAIETLEQLIAELEENYDINLYNEHNLVPKEEVNSIIDDIIFFSCELIENPVVTEFSDKRGKTYNGAQLSRLKQAVASFAAHFKRENIKTANFYLQNQIKSKDQLVEEKATLLQQQEKLSTLRNKFFTDTIIELLAYRELFKSKIKDHKERSELVDNYSGFIFEIENTLKHFPGIKSSNTKTIFEQLTTKYGYTETITLLAFEEKIGNIKQNLEKKYPITNNSDFNHQERKAFRAHCKLLKDATKNYNDGKKVVEQEIEKEKTIYEKKTSKLPELTETTYFVKKEERQKRKALHLKVGGKYFNKFASSDVLSDSLKDSMNAFQNNLSIIEKAKTDYEKQEENTRNIKKSIKQRVTTLLADYRSAVATGYEKDAKKILFAISTLLKLDDYQHSKVKFKDLCDFYNVEESSFNSIATEKFKKNLQNGKFEQALEQALLEKGYLIPEYNPYISLSAFASQKLEQIIKLLSSTNPNYAKIVDKLRTIEETYISRNRQIPDALITEVNNLVPVNGNTEIDVENQNIKTQFDVLTKQYKEKYNALRQTDLNLLKKTIENTVKHARLVRFRLPFVGNMFITDDDLYQICVLIERQIELIRKTQHHVNFTLPFPLTLEDYLEKHFKNDAPENLDNFFKDLFARFYYIEKVAIPCIKTEGDSESLQMLRENLLEPYRQALNKMAQKYNYPVVINFDETAGKYNPEARKHPTLKELKTATIAEWIERGSDGLAVWVTFGQVAISFSGGLTFIGLSTALQSVLAITLFTIAGGFPVTIPVIFVVLAGLTVASHFLGRIPAVRRMFDKASATIEAHWWLKYNPIAFLLNKLVFKSTFSPRMTSLIASFAILASIMAFPVIGVGYALGLTFCLATWKTNYALFAKDTKSLFPKLYTVGAKRLIWDKLGANNMHFTKKGDLRLGILNAFLVTAALVGTLVAFAMTGPIGFVVLVAATVIILGLNTILFNRKKATMIAMISLIVFTAGLEAFFSYVPLKKQVADIVSSTIQLVFQNASKHVRASADVVAGIIRKFIGVFASSIFLVTIGGFFSVFYYAAGDLITMKLGRAIKNFFITNFTDEYFRERDGWGKARTIVTFAIRAILLVTGLSLVGYALLFALSAKKSSVSGTVHEYLQALSDKSAQWLGIGTAILAGIVEGCFNGRAIARVFTKTFAGLILDKLFKSKDIVYELKADLNAKQRRSQRVNLKESNANILKLTTDLTPAKTWLGRKIDWLAEKIAGKKNYTESQQKEMKVETAKVALSILKEKESFHSLWLDRASADQVKVFFKEQIVRDANGIPQLDKNGEVIKQRAITSTHVGNLVLSNLGTEALDVLSDKENCKHLPSSLILYGVASTLVQPMLTEMANNDAKVKKLTIYLDQAPTRYNRELDIPTSVSELHFTCENLTDVNDYFALDLEIKSDANTVIFNNVNAATVRNGLLALDRGKSLSTVKRIVLKNLSSEAISAAMREIGLKNDLKNIEIMIDGITDSEPTANNGIDTAAQLAESPLNIVQQVHFDNVPKYFLEKSDHYQRVNKKFPEKFNCSEKGNAISKPTIHSDPQSNRDSANALRFVYLLINALGNAFAAIVNGTIAFMNLGRWWSPNNKFESGGPTYSNDYYGIVNQSRDAFSNLYATNSPADVLGYGSASAVVGGIMSFSVNYAPTTQLANELPHDSVTEEGIKRTCDAEKLNPQHSFKNEEELSKKLTSTGKDEVDGNSVEVARAKTNVTKYSHAQNRNCYFNHRKASKVLATCKEDFCLDNDKAGATFNHNNGHNSHA